MTRRRVIAKLVAHRQTQAVGDQLPRGCVASVQTMAKMVLWAAFFAALFTAHAHVGLRTALLRAEARRLQSRVDDLMEERRHLSADLAAVQDSGRIQRIAEEQLGMVALDPADRLVLSTTAVAEVEEAADLWHIDAPPTERTRVRDWITVLASLWAGHETQS